MRPLARRRAMMALPPRVLMRARKPSLRGARTFFGLPGAFHGFLLLRRHFSAQEEEKAEQFLNFSNSPQ